MKLPDTVRAQELRCNMTREERHLWYDFLKNYPVPFHRQKSIGPYFVDFYCNQVRMVIELDGGQHYEDNAIEYDLKRTKYLNGLGLKVIRYTNLDVIQNFDGVCSDIDRMVRLKIVENEGIGH